MSSASLIPPKLAFVAIALAQQKDSELQKLRQSSTTSLKFQEVAIEGSSLPLVCDISTSISRPYLPQSKYLNYSMDYPTQEFVPLKN